jgi:pSer/pThr/pTyr-binding forkhead associated (FHA) protein
VGSPAFQVASVAELVARREAELSGHPFVLFRTDTGLQQVISLPADAGAVPIGREPDGGIRLDWDAKVSRVHALLERVGGEWTIVDDGLSRNGTYVNGARLLARRRLADGDTVACGGVTILYRNPSAGVRTETVNAPLDVPAARRFTPAQRNVLVALCRPLKDSPHASPATNKKIAEELHVSTDAVKTHLRRLAEIFGVDALPQNSKRSALAWKALEEGAISAHDLK